MLPPQYLVAALLAPHFGQVLNSLKVGKANVLPPYRSEQCGRRISPPKGVIALMTEEELIEYLKNNEDLVEPEVLKASLAADEPLTKLTFVLPARMIAAAIVANNRRWEERLRKAGIDI